MEEIGKEGVYYDTSGRLCSPIAVKIGFWCENSTEVPKEESAQPTSAPTGASGVGLPPERGSAIPHSTPMRLLAMNPFLLFQIKPYSPPGPIPSTLNTTSTDISYQQQTLAVQAVICWLYLIL